MKEGAVVLAHIQQADGRFKLRPVLVLRQMPPHGDWLVSGISSQVHQEVVGFDYILASGDSNFTSSGLKKSSLVRLGFLTTLSNLDFAGRLGAVSPELLVVLRRRLVSYLDR